MNRHKIKYWLIRVPAAIIVLSSEICAAAWALSKVSWLLSSLLLLSRICRGLSSDWRGESAVAGEACRLLVSSQDTVVAYLLATDVRLCCSASRRPTPTPVSPSVCVLLCFCSTFTIALLSEDCAYGKKKGCVVYRSGLSSSLGCRFFLTEFVREEAKRGRPVPQVNCVCGCRDH